MKRLFLLVCLLCAIAPKVAFGHSTGGLKKQTLQVETLTIDHVAYYLERQVGKRLDAAGRRGRYYIDDFLRIEQQEDLARVYANVRDQKTSGLTEEVFRLKRNADDSWNHVTAAGKVITAQIYHYVKPGQNKAVKAVFNAILAGVVLFVVGRKIVDWRRQREADG